MSALIPRFGTRLPRIPALVLRLFAALAARLRFAVAGRLLLARLRFAGAGLLLVLRLVAAGLLRLILPLVALRAGLRRLVALRAGLLRVFRRVVRFVRLLQSAFRH